MAQDPAQGGTSPLVTGTSVTGTSVTSVPIPWPPRSGPESDKEAWVAFAREVAKGNEEAWEVVDEQAALIASLEAELARLRAQLAESETPQSQSHAPEPTTLKLGTSGPNTPGPTEGKPANAEPRANRRKTSEAIKNAILADLAAGLTQSEAARRHGVSAMTVSRIVRGL